MSRAALGWSSTGLSSDTAAGQRHQAWSPLACQSSASVRLSRFHLGCFTHGLSRPAGPFPGDGNDGLQMVDVRGVADFVVQAIDRDRGGVCNLAGPRRPGRDFVDAWGITQPCWGAHARLR